MMEIQKYKEVLNEQLTAITKELSSLGVQDPNNKSDWITAMEDSVEADSNLVADRTEEYNERRSILANLENRFNNIVSALIKIESGMYGKCEICNAEIETDRLDVNPSARTCKAHLDEEEKIID